MQWIPAPLAARALDVPLRTVHFWIDHSILEGRATMTRRRWVKVASCRTLIQERMEDEGSKEERFDNVLTSKPLPAIPADILRESPNVLVSQTK